MTDRLLRRADAREDGAREIVGDQIVRRCLGKRAFEIGSELRQLVARLAQGRRARGGRAQHDLEDSGRNDTTAGPPRRERREWDFPEAAAAAQYDSSAATFSPVDNGSSPGAPGTNAGPSRQQASRGQVDLAVDLTVRRSFRRRSACPRAAQELAYERDRKDRSNAGGDKRVAAQKRPELANAVRTRLQYSSAVRTPSGIGRGRDTRDDRLRRSSGSGSRAALRRFEGNRRISECGWSARQTLVTSRTRAGSSRLPRTTAGSPRSPCDR